MKRTIIISVLCILGINAYAQNQEPSLDPSALKSVIKNNDKIIDFLKDQVKNKEDQITKLGLDKPKMPQVKSQKAQKKSFIDAVREIADLDSLYNTWPKIKDGYKVKDKDKKIYEAYEIVYNMVLSLHSDFNKEENDKWLAENVDDIKPNLLEKHRQQLEDLYLKIGDFEYIYEEEFKVVLNKVENAKDKETLTIIENSDEYQDILRIPVLVERINKVINNKNNTRHKNGWSFSIDEPK